MTYTAEQLRRDAIAIERMHGETLTVEWRGHQASQLRAHADALEELTALREQLAERDAEKKQRDVCITDLRRQLTELEAENKALKGHAEAIKDEFYLSWAGDVSREEFNEWPVIAAYRAAYPKEDA